MGGRGPSELEGGDQVDGDDLGEAVGLLPQRRHDVGDAGVGDDHVDPTVALDRLVHEGRRGPRDAHVAGDGVTLGERRGERLDSVGAPRSDHDRGPERVEHAGGAGTDPRAGAGHDRHLPVEAELGERVDGSSSIGHAAHATPRFYGASTSHGGSALTRRWSLVRSGTPRSSAKAT